VKFHRATRRVAAGALAVGALALAIPATAGAATKLPKVGYEKPPTASVSETGSTLLYPLFNIWAGGYNTVYPQVTITTAGTGRAPASPTPATARSTSAHRTPISRPARYRPTLTC